MSTVAIVAGDRCPGVEQVSPVSGTFFTSLSEHFTLHVHRRRQSLPVAATPFSTRSFTLLFCSKSVSAGRSHQLNRKGSLNMLLFAPPPPTSVSFLLPPGAANLTVLSPTETAVRDVIQGINSCLRYV